MPTEKVYSEVKKIASDEKEVLSYAPEGKELEVRDLIKRRREEMQTYRRNIYGRDIEQNVYGLDIEQIWREADREYIPRELGAKEKHENFVTDTDESGNSTTRLVAQDITEPSWKSDNSEPTLFVKIHTAMSIIISRNPEAFFQPMGKKYEATTNLARSLWKSSWLMDSSKEQIKLFAFNLMKYGWSPGRTYPRILKRNKEILTELDTEHPENNKYETRVITDYNGVHREALDPWKTWIDEMTRPNDPFSMNDWYYEKDYSYDGAMLEVGHLKNWKYVSKSRDIVKIGFYENKNKDKYGIYIPSANILLYNSPLPNDDGLLSIWHTYWLLRDTRIPYGIGIWEVIKQKKGLYDKFMNMTMNQLTLAIEKMFFYTGTNPLQGDGKIKIEPGVGYQNLGGKIDWMEVPGPGKDSFDGLGVLKKGIDEDSGISDTVSSDLVGKTLGQDLLSRENSLKRMNVPLDNIADALNQEAYISLSWLAQTLSTPEVKEFADENELMAYEKETGINSFEMSPNFDEEGTQTSITATYLPEIALNLEPKDDQLIESKENRFFQIGKDIQPQQLKWRGIITVEPRSILVPSVEIEKQRKGELFNVVVPVLQGPPELFARPVQQILKINEEDLEDWLPDSWIQYLETGELPPPPAQSLFMPPDGETMKGQQGMVASTSPTVVPRGEISNPTPQPTGGLRMGATK